MAKVLQGSNTKAQWHHDDFPGGSVFPNLDKFVIHTTETTSWPGYEGGASAPNATYNPKLREIRQHFPNNVSSRALRDPDRTPVRENRDKVFQLEIICYSDKKLGQKVGGLWVGDLTDSHFADIARMMIQLNREEGLPLQTSVTWKEGTTSPPKGVRLSSSGYDAYQGILGHVHVSGNEHWDPGGFRASRLMAKIAQLTGEDDMTPDEAKAAFREVLAERRIRLDWDGSDHSFYEALSFIHFNAADGSFVGDIPASSIRENRRGTPTSAKAISNAVAGLNKAVTEAGREIGLTPEQIDALAASFAAKVRP